VSAYAARLRDGLRHEQRVCDAVNACGWHCASFGQALLTVEVRDALRAWRTDLRWMPDLLAVRPAHDLAPAEDCVRLIDAKWSGRHDTGRYDFECSSVAAHHRWMTGFGHDVWLVFWDMRCCRVGDALASPQLRKGTWAGVGSGTPFWLLPCDDPCVIPLADAFRREAA
jgi:hypothetical protein